MGQPLARDLEWMNYVIVAVQRCKFEQLQIMALVETEREREMREGGREIDIVKIRRATSLHNGRHARWLCRRSCTL